MARYGYTKSTAKLKPLNPEDNFQSYPPSRIQIPLIRRKYWFGLKPDETRLKEMTEPHKKVCFVSSESPECKDAEHCIMEVQELQKRNMMFKDWPDTPFNFIIGGDGNIYEGRGWLSQYQKFGTEAMQRTLQIVYIGYFKDKDPPQEMVDLGAMLIEYGKQRGFISEDYSYMECPLEEYYQFPQGGLEAYYKSPEYKEFLDSIPPLPPKRPPTCRGN